MITSIRNVNNYVWVVEYVVNGESCVEYCHSEAEVNELIKDLSN